MIIEVSKKSDVIKDLIRNLKNNQLKHKTIVDDLFALEVALKNGNTLFEFYYASDYPYRADAEALKKAFIQKALKVYQVSTKTMASLLQKDNASMMIAIVEIPAKSLLTFKDKDFIVVTDKIELPGNLGTIIRTMDGVGAQGLISVDPFTKLNNPKLVHTSRGMNLITDSYEGSYQEVLDFLQKNHFTIYLGEPKLGHSYYDLDYKGKIAIVVGSERYGINPDWYNHHHEKVYIPMEGIMTSLNVGVATSILLYEAYKKRK